jgi:hypothetical protein
MSSKRLTVFGAALIAAPLLACSSSGEPSASTSQAVIYIRPPNACAPGAQTWLGIYVPGTVLGYVNDLWLADDQVGLDAADNVYILYSAWNQATANIDADIWVAVGNESQFQQTNIACFSDTIQYPGPIPPQNPQGGGGPTELPVVGVIPVCLTNGDLATYDSGTQSCHFPPPPPPPPPHHPIVPFTP